MKNLKLLILSIPFLLLFGCSEDSNISNSNNSDNEINIRGGRDRCSIDIANLPVEDQLKQVIAEFVAESLKDPSMKAYFMQKLFTDNNNDIRNPEFLIAEHMSDPINTDNLSNVGSGPIVVQTLEDLMTQWFIENHPDQLELLENLCSLYSDLVLKFPWWTVDIINEEGGVENVDIGCIGAIEPVICNGSPIRMMYYDNEAEILDLSLPIRHYIPLYVKKAEYHVAVEGDPMEIIDDMAEYIGAYYDNCSFSNQELLEFIKTINCSSIQYVDFSKMATFFENHCNQIITRNPESDCCDGIDNDGDGLIDCEDIDDCPCEIELCNDGCDNDNDGQIDEDDCTCEGVYQRDCVPEDNVLVGLKFDDAMFLHICQEKEEDHILIRFNFDAVQICDSDQSFQCPVDELVDFGIGGFPTKFFEIQKTGSSHPDYNPDATLYEDNVIWMSEFGTYYWKVFPLYLAIRKNYLGESYENNQWIPSEIGDKIGIATLEEDNHSLSISEQFTKSITTHHAFNAGLTYGFSPLISTNFSYSFDITKVSSTTSTTARNYQKDIFINNYSLEYGNKDEVIPDPTGVANNNWYGQIPGNSDAGVDLMYLEFRIHD